MTNLLPTLRLALLAAASSLLLATASCSKKEDATPTPAPTTGSIEGTVSPATAVATVTATSTGNVTFLQTPAPSGAFAFANLAPGSYALTCDPKPGFVAPAPRTVTVVAGQVAVAGTIAVDAVTQGSIAGVIDPVDAVVRVELVSGTGAVTPLVPDAGTGAFRFDGLGLGTYTVRFVVAPGFLPVSDRPNLQLSAVDPTTGLGTVVVRSDGTPRGTMSWTENGVTYTATVFNNGASRANDFVISASSLNRAAGGSEQVKLYVVNGAFNGVGTYPLGPNVAAEYRVFSSISPSYGVSAQAGTIVVTSYTPSPRSVAGTFAFTASTQIGGSINITNGRFNLRF